MTIIYWLRVSLLFLFFTLPIQAQEGDELKEYEADCEKTMTTLDMRLCSMTAYEQADKELNEVYKQLVASYEQAFQEARTRYKDEEDLNPYQEQLKLLRQSQRDWIKFRDSSCALEASQWWGGTWMPVAYTGCQTIMTE